MSETKDWDVFDAFEEKVAELDRLRAELAKVTADHKAMAEYALKLDASNDDYQAELATKDARIAELEAIIANLDERSAQYERDLAEANGELAGKHRAFEYQTDELRHCRTALEAAKAELAKWKCPIGLESSHMLCSAGTCFVCTQSLRNDWDEMKAALEAANARIAEDREEHKLVLSSEAALRRENEALRKEQKLSSFHDMLTKLSQALARAERAEAEADSLRATIDNMRAMNVKLTWEATGKELRAEARIAELETAGRELHKCLAAMVNRWEPDTEGLDRIMWENACEALGRDIWAHLKTT